VGPIRSVAVSRPFFNPSIGQKVQIRVELAKSGTVTVLILDRDGYPVRKLVAEKDVAKGQQAFEWDGRDDFGTIVSDEGYSLKIELVSGGQRSVYFPAKEPVRDLVAETKYYDRTGAVLSYKLTQAARVHVQAGIARIDPKTKETTGPVLKTLVNREPRPAGAVIENWNGFDEGGTFYIPDLPDFVVAVAASSLPENAIITTGNRTVSFLEVAAKRSGVSLLPPSSGGHEHHHGLSALDDVAPKLKATPLDASWSANDRVWRPFEKKLKVSFSLSGPSADSFQRQPGKLNVFLDRQTVLEVPHPRSGDTIQVPLSRLSPGPHIVALNWSSAYGPTAVDAFRIFVGKAARTQPAAVK
jgi:hypothetical protein